MPNTDGFKSSLVYRLKINKSNLSIEKKDHCLRLLDQYARDPENSASSLNAIELILKISDFPLNVNLHLNLNLSYENFCLRLNKSWDKMETTVYGHLQAKMEILQYYTCKTFCEKPRVIGLCGPPGVGKTCLVVNGIAEALNLPLYQISLGGLKDVTYFSGTLPCWKGAHQGIFTDILISHGNNAIVYIDELDKVSCESLNDIYGFLTHVLDPLSNNKIKDHYLGIELDLSNLTFILSYNDSSILHAPLRDRIKEIILTGFNENEKLHIAKNFIIPECLNDFNLSGKDLKFNDDIIVHANNIAESTSSLLLPLPLSLSLNTGVRNLKKYYQSVISNLILNIACTREGYDFLICKKTKQKSSTLTLKSVKTVIHPYFRNKSKKVFTFPYTVTLEDLNL